MTYLFLAVRFRHIKLFILQTPSLISLHTSLITLIIPPNNRNADFKVLGFKYKHYFRCTVISFLHNNTAPAELCGLPMYPHPQRFTPQRFLCLDRASDTLHHCNGSQCNNHKETSLFYGHFPCMLETLRNVLNLWNYSVPGLLRGVTVGLTKNMALRVFFGYTQTRKMLFIYSADRIFCHVVKKM